MGDDRRVTEVELDAGHRLDDAAGPVIQERGHLLRRARERNLPPPVRRAPQQVGDAAHGQLQRGFRRAPVLAQKRKLAAHQLKEGLLTALYRRERTGEGA